MDIIFINHGPTEQEYFGKIITTSDPYTRYPLDDKHLVKLGTYLSEHNLIKKDFTVYSSPSNRTKDTAARFQYLTREFFSINPQIKIENNLNEIEADFLDLIIKSNLTEKELKEIKKWDSKNKNLEYLDKILEFINNHKDESQLICFTHPLIMKLLIYKCLDKDFKLKDFTDIDIYNFGILHIKFENDKLKLFSLLNP